MKIPKKTRSWEHLVARYMVASGIPNFMWDYPSRRFNGIFGWSFVRSTPRLDGGWAQVPFYFKRYENERANGHTQPLVMFLTSRDSGPNIEDSYVLMRIETFAPFLVAKIDADPERHIRMEK